MCIFRTGHRQQTVINSWSTYTQGHVAPAACRSFPEPGVEGYTVCGSNFLFELLHSFLHAQLLDIAPLKLLTKQNFLGGSQLFKSRSRKFKWCLNWIKLINRKIIGQLVKQIKTPEDVTLAFVIGNLTMFWRLTDQTINQENNQQINPHNVNHCSPQH